MEYWGAGGGGGGGGRGGKGYVGPLLKLLGGSGPPAPPSFYAYVIINVTGVISFDEMSVFTGLLHNRIMAPNKQELCFLTCN